MAAGLLDPACDAVPVEGHEPLERGEDHEGKGALFDVDFVRHGLSYGIPI
jgi:hypothetical protein